MTTTLDIKIQGREYRVACAAAEVASLQAAAELLDARMGEIAVMTALNLAHELNAAQKDATPQVVDQAVDAGESQRRIKAIEARLDEVLSPQGKLL
jgi:cell division protein ZapA